MYAGLASLLVPPFLGIFAAFIRPVIDKASSENTGVAMGFGGAMLALFLSVYALITGIQAYRQGEHSWIVHVGLISAILIAAFWIFMIIGEFLFPH